MQKKANAKTTMLERVRLVLRNSKGVLVAGVE